MNDRRSIQDIIPPARSKPIRVTRDPQQEIVKPPVTPPATPPLPPRPPKKMVNHTFTLLAIAVGVIAVIVIAFGLVSTVFHRASVSIELNQFVVPVSETFEASPDGLLLSYTKKTVEEELTTTVPQSGSEYVEERASGTIVIYNEYSSGTQRLITNTRFETPEGLIYRIQNPVVVPGYKTVEGKKVPGEIEVTVYADEPGEKYNIGMTSFTIPGLKGSAQFETMYARSKGSFSGGFVGERAVVEKSVRDAAVSDLKNQLESKVRDSFASQLAENELPLESEVVVEFIEQADVAGQNGAVVRVKAIASSSVILEEKLAAVIATEGGVQYQSPLRIENLDTLSFVAKPSETEGNIAITISGDVVLVGVYDEKRLISDLSGKDQRNIGSVLSGYPAISDMKISIYPFWRGVLPKDAERIKVVIQSPEMNP
ncbi:MAG: hypothetical protein AAB439_03555 [Patescibacteria group bacterium]